jgi:hypothetical protein
LWLFPDRQKLITPYFYAQEKVIENKKSLIFGGFYLAVENRLFSVVFIGHKK